MKLLPALLCLSLASCSMFSGEDAPKTEMAQTQNFHSFQVSSLEGQPVNLADYKGKVVLVVNVASECGYTKQYAGLEALHKELAPRGFAVLGFPSNEFGGQEPGSAEQIRSFCSSKFGVTFPMFGKLETKAGANQSPLFAWLGGATGKLPGWNFSKYLIGKDGQAIAFYPSGVAPESAELRTAIEAALK
ncbi:MAG: hypothetical protein RL277_983 [Planctomycetota bacterium]|jgi:glutathione peroxidase